MPKLKQRLEAVANRLGIIQAGIWRAYRKQKRKREAAARLDVQAERATTAAENRRAKGHSGTRKDREASRLRARAEKKRAQARWWIGRIKELKIKKAGKEQVKAELERELDALIRDRKLKFNIDGNKITGGTPKQRFRAACLLSAKRCAEGKRRNFYSQPGSFSVNRCLTGESYGQRSDCSQWITSVCWTAGLDDPNGTNWSAGYTGTMIGSHGKWTECSRAELLAQGWGYCVYGYGTGFHTEAYVGPGNRTIGHGDAAINAGDLDMFRPQRFFIYGG